MESGFASWIERVSKISPHAPLILKPVAESEIVPDMKVGTLIRDFWQPEPAIKEARIINIKP